MGPVALWYGASMCPVWREVAGSAIIGEHSIGHLPGQEERTLQPFIASSIKWDCGPTCAATNGPTHSCTWRATEKDGAVNRCACCNTFCREINNLRAAVLPDVFHLCADFVLSGYFRGKRNVEAALRQRFPDTGVALRPSFIHGTRQVGSVGIPLSAVGELFFPARIWVLKADH